MGYQGNQLFEESVSAVTATPSVQLGERRWAGGVEYIYGYNLNSGKQACPGRSVYPVAGSTNYTFTVTNATAKEGCFYGVVQNATISTGSYGWVAIKGLTNVVPDTNAVSWAAGVFLAVGADDGFVSCCVTAMTSARLVGWAVTSGVTFNTTNALSALGQGYIRSDIFS